MSFRSLKDDLKNPEDAHNNKRDSSNSGHYKFGEFCLDAAKRVLLRGGVVVPLTPKAFDVLVLLLSHHGHVVAKEELLTRVWPDTIVEENNLNVNVSLLRKALGEKPNDHQFIVTVPGRGYQFVSDVRFTGGEEVQSQIASNIALSPARDFLIGDETEPHAGNAIVGHTLRFDRATDSDVFVSILEKDPPSLDHDRSGRSRGSSSAPGSLENKASVSSGARWIRAHVEMIVIFLTLAFLMSSLYLWRREDKAGHSASAAHNVEFTRVTNARGEEAYPSLSPDGKSLVYATNVDGKWAIYLSHLGSNNAVKLTGDSATDNWQPTFSPDGDLIAFSSGDSRGIFVMGATGENVKRVTEFGAWPSWSPDQRQIVFATDNTWNPTSRRINPSDLWVVDVETSEKHQLPTLGDAVQPAWSAQGNRIAFWSQNAGGSTNIFTLPAVGGKPVAVTNDKFTNWNPVWSPDGRYLYFVSNRGGAMNLWRVPIDEKSGNVLGSPESLTTPAPHIQHLSISRDGRFLAYVNDSIIQNVEEIQFDPQRELLVGKPRWLTQGIVNVVSPDLTSDGKWLAYGTLGEKQDDLFVIGIDGTGLRQLTNKGSRDRSPRWSPDGKRIAFESDRNGNFEIWIMNADGSQLKQLTSSGAPGVSGAIWSPDGNRLAYTARGGRGTFIAEVSDTIGGPITNVFSVPGSSEAEFRANSWSPDGRKLAGFSYRRRSNSPVKDAAHMLCTYSFDTQEFKQWEMAGARPIWLSDSRRLIFLEGNTVYLLDTDSKRIRKLLDAAPNGLDFLALSRDNQKILLTIATYEADIWITNLQP